VALPITTPSHPTPVLGEGMPWKYCRQCDHQHPRADFHADKSSRTGLYSQCKYCRSVNRRDHDAEKKRRTNGSSPDTPNTADESDKMRPGKRTCVQCQEPFIVGKTMPDRVVCGMCQSRLGLSADAVRASYQRQHNKMATMPPSVSQRIFEYAIREVLFRHQQEFKDICLLELDRRSRNNTDIWDDQKKFAR